jgi:coenzyme F420-reducing hydrogenase beta subunit
MNKAEKKFYKEQSDNLRLVYLNCGIDFILQELLKFTKTSLNLKIGNVGKLFNRKERAKVYSVLKEMRRIWNSRA